MKENEDDSKWLDKIMNLPLLDSIDCIILFADAWQIDKRQKDGERTYAVYSLCSWYRQMNYDEGKIAKASTTGYKLYVQRDQ